MKHISMRLDVPDILILVLFTLRIYAICGQSKAVLYMALAMILARIGVDIWVSALVYST